MKATFPRLQPTSQKTLTLQARPYRACKMMGWVAACLLLLFGAVSYAPRGYANDGYDSSKQPWAILHTSRGVIVIELYERFVPRITKHFINLATGAVEWTDPKTKQKVKRRFYDGLTFHRVLPTYLVQGGCPLGNGRGGPGFSVNDEFHPSLKHQDAGYVGFSNIGPNTIGSQFYITLRSTPWLDMKEIKGRYCENFSTPVRCLSNRDCADYARQFANAAEGTATCKQRTMRRGYSIFGKVVHGMDVVNGFSEIPLEAGSRPSTPITIKRVKIQLGKRWKRSWLRLDDDE
ncbi:MAG: peptidylprolyl isomerase [Myxococcales bacterium]|nr:peptidylprolyl isomerase [Myxococcales bacterium]